MFAIRETEYEMNWIKPQITNVLLYTYYVCVAFVSFLILIIFFLYWKSESIHYRYLANCFIKGKFSHDNEMRASGVFTMRTVTRCFGFAWNIIVICNII